MCDSKCKICKAMLSVSPYDGSFVIYEGGYYCSSCLFEKRTNSRTRKDRWPKEEADAKLAALKKATEDYFHFQETKEKLFEYIEQTYTPSYLAPAFYEKMNSIFDGTLKGLRIPIPPEDILDMFQRQQSKLDKQAIKKWGSAQPVPSVRINYDLAILLNKYDKYLDWKRAKEIETQEAVQNAEERSSTEQYVYIAPQVQHQVSDEVNIASILDDLFD